MIGNASQRFLPIAQVSHNLNLALGLSICNPHTTLVLPINLIVSTLIGPSLSCQSCNVIPFIFIATFDYVFGEQFSCLQSLQIFF
jgi:hypothetical protein